MTRYYSPTDIRDWAEIQRLRSRRQPFNPDDDPAEVAAWVRATYVVTGRDAAFASKVEDTLARSGGNQRHALLVDGPAVSGKTEMVLAYAIARSGISPAGKLPGRKGGYRDLPTVFVEADPLQQGAGLLRSICRFIALPPARNEGEMRDALKEQLPLRGTNLVVVDDAHMLRRVNDTSTKLTDSLRTALRLPVTFVFVGAGLEQSALLRMAPRPTAIAPRGGSPKIVGYESTDQIRFRKSDFAIAPTSLPDDKDEVRELAVGFTKTIRVGLPSMQFSSLRARGVLPSLIDRAEGHQGKVLETLKNATVMAYTSGLGDVCMDVMSRALDEPTTSAWLVS